MRREAIEVSTGGFCRVFGERLGVSPSFDNTCATGADAPTARLIQVRESSKTQNHPCFINYSAKFNERPAASRCGRHAADVAWKLNCAGNHIVGDKGLALDETHRPDHPARDWNVSDSWHLIVWFGKNSSSETRPTHGRYRLPCSRGCSEAMVDEIRMADRNYFRSRSRFAVLRMVTHVSNAFGVWCCDGFTGRQPGKSSRG